MTTPRPRISVAVATHGRPAYLEQSLRSILAQTVPAAEIVVSEDGEDAATAEVVARLVAEGAPIRHFRNVPPLRSGANRQRALSLTTGEFVAMLDDDDAWEPEFLERTSAALIEHPECGFAMTDHWLMDEDGRLLAEESDAFMQHFGRDLMSAGVHDDVLNRHLEAKSMTLVTSLFRRDVLEEIEFIPIRADISADFVLFAELGARHVAVYYFPERLGRYRVHTRQLTTGNRTGRGVAVLASLRRIADRYELQGDERARLAKLFRATTVEQAIAHAHERERRTALRVLASYGEFGWGMPSPRRIVVLIALLLGARPRRG